MATFSNAALRRLIEQILDRINPDILHPHIDPGAMKFHGPQPNPWTSGLGAEAGQPAMHVMAGSLFARAVIERASGLLRASAVFAGTEGEKRATGVVTSQVMEDVDGYCGNGARRWPWPWPWPGRWKADPSEVSAIDLLVAGSEFHAYAEAIKGTALADTFAKAADTLITTGAKRLESPAAR